MQEGSNSSNDNSNNSNIDSKETNKLNKFSKIPSSCDSCRQRKLACNKNKPSCNNCLKREIECQYNFKPMQKNKTSLYIIELQNKILEMEQLLKEDTNKEQNGFINSLSLSHPNFKNESEIIIHLIDSFFNKMVRFMSIIHEPSFRLDYSLNKVDKLLLYSICAIGSKYSNYFSILSTKDKPAGRQFADKAEQLLMERFTHTPTISSIQSGLLLGAYEFMAGKGEMAIFFLSITHRAALYLGLNFMDSNMLSNPMNPNLLSPLELEIRRRIWWECLSSDVITATLVGRPLIIDDRDFVIKLPKEDNEFLNFNNTINDSNNNNTLVYYNYYLYTLINYWRVIFRFTHHRYLRKWYSNDLILDHLQTNYIKLVEFEFKIPINMRLNLDIKLQNKPTGLQNCGAILLCNIQLLIILLHRSHLAHGIENNNISTSELESKKICIEAANKIASVLELYQNYLEELNDVYTSFAVFNAATILNNVLNTNKKDYSHSHQLHHHIKLMKQFLKVHSKTWYMNFMFLEILKLMDQIFKRTNNENWLTPTSTSYIQWYFNNVGFNSQSL